MANKLLTISDITRETLRLLHAECQLLKACTRKYEDRFSSGGAAIGASVDIRKPAKYSVSKQADITGETQSSGETLVTLKVNKRRVIGLTFTSEDLTLELNDFSDRFLRKAAARMAREIDLDIAQEILTSGTRIARADLTQPISFEDVTAANAQLTTQFAEDGDRLPPTQP